MVTNPTIRAVSFTGSTPVGAEIHTKADATVAAAYACAGQWCTSTSRALVEAPILERFQERVLERALSFVERTASGGQRIVYDESCPPDGFLPDEFPPDDAVDREWPADA